MQPIVVEMSPTTLEVFNDNPSSLVFSQEIIARGNNIYVSGLVSLESENLFKVNYYINNTLIAHSNPTSLLAVAVTLNSNDLPLGESEFKMEFLSPVDELIATATKKLWYSYYDFFITTNGAVQPKRDLNVNLNSSSRIFIGLSQPLLNSVAENIQVPLTFVDNSSFTIYPIFDETWVVGSEELPSKLETIHTSTLSSNAGEGRFSLNSICYPGKPFYGIILEPKTSVAISLLFKQAQFSYYKVFVSRPEVIKSDKVTISWEDLHLLVEENFEKFQLFRDNTLIYESDDFSVKSYDDWVKDYDHPDGVELNNEYSYLLKVWVTVPLNPDWYTKLPYEPDWVRTEEENSYIVFTSQDMHFKYLESLVYVDLSEVEIITPNILYSEQKGLYVNQSSGSYLHKINLLQEELLIDFESREKLLELRLSTNEDNTIFTNTEDMSFYKNFSNGKMYVYSLADFIHGLRIW